MNQAPLTMKRFNHLFIFLFFLVTFATAQETDSVDATPPKVAFNDSFWIDLGLGEAKGQSAIVFDINLQISKNMFVALDLDQVGFSFINRESGEEYFDAGSKSLLAGVLHKTKMGMFLLAAGPARQRGEKGIPGFVPNKEFGGYGVKIRGGAYFAIRYIGIGISPFFVLNEESFSGVTVNFSLGIINTRKK